MSKRGARLGQHFLNAPWAARDLLAAVKPQSGEVIVEIGPGRGALTEVLLSEGNTVLAIEKDEALVGILQEKFAAEIAQGRLRVIEGDVRSDALEQSLGSAPYVVAANIPYYITGEIIRHFLTAAHQPRAMALLIQKEVAERIVAREKESILSLSVKAYGTPRIIAKVPKGCFNPPPAVDSAIILIDHISRTFFKELTEEVFFTVVRAGFSAKRKLLANNLGTLIPHAATVLEKVGINPKARAEDLSLSDWHSLALIAR